VPTDDLWWVPLHTCHPVKFALQTRPLPAAFKLLLCSQPWLLRKIVTQYVLTRYYVKKSRSSPAPTITTILILFVYDLNTTHIPVIKGTYWCNINSVQQQVTVIQIQSAKLLDLIEIAFITGNSSLEPLIEGLCAQIHVNLSWRVFGRNWTGDLTDF